MESCGKNAHREYVQRDLAGLLTPTRSEPLHCVVHHSCCYDGQLRNHEGGPLHSRWIIVAEDSFLQEIPDVLNRLTERDLDIKVVRPRDAAEVMYSMNDLDNV